MIDLPTIRKENEQRRFAVASTTVTGARDTRAFMLAAEACKDVDDLLNECERLQNRLDVIRKMATNEKHNRPTAGRDG